MPDLARNLADQLVPEAGGRILAELRDAGTEAVVARGVVPGMDRLFYREVRLEEDANAWDVPQHNAAMRTAAGGLDLAPWPEKVARCAPVDLTKRYDHAVRVQLLQRMSLLPDGSAFAWGDVPEGMAHVVDPASPVDPYNREASHVSGFRTPAELRAEESDPTPYLRLPFGNETGGTVLRRAALFRWDGLQASRFAFRLENDPLFTPFDLSHPERYEWRRDDGSVLEGGEEFAQLGAGADVVLYLVPRRWRWWLHLWVHYEFVQTWWSQIIDEQFSRIFYDRPPFYPMRHDVVHTAAEAEIWHEWEATFLSWDSGVDSKVSLSEAAAALRAEIIAQQYYDACTAYALLGAEPGRVVVWQDPPRVGDLVVGLGLRSPSLGVESRVWAIQAVDASALYPRQTIGQFFSDFYYAGGGG